AQLHAGEFDTNEDLACDMYQALVEQAADAGFHRYEIANFAKDDSGHLNSNHDLPNRACQHNVNYWRGGFFHGLGPSATSYVRGIRSKNFSNTQLYCEQLENRKRPVESREELPPLGRAGETAAF